jgi:hypothetical protein
MLCMMAIMRLPLRAHSSDDTVGTAVTPAGDLNRDSVVDAADVKILILAINTWPEYMATDPVDAAALLPLADFDHDGLIGTGDIAGFAGAYRDYEASALTARVQAPAAGLAGLGGTNVLPLMQGGTPVLDLDIDSDNTNGTDAPDRSVQEDFWEDGYDEFGNPVAKYVPFNDDNDDQDGWSDYAQDGPLPAEAGELVPFCIELDPGTGLPLGPQLAEFTWSTDPGSSAAVRAWSTGVRFASRRPTELAAPGCGTPHTSSMHRGGWRRSPRSTRTRSSTMPASTGRSARRAARAPPQSRSPT